MLWDRDQQHWQHIPVFSATSKFGKALGFSNPGWVNAVVYIGASSESTSNLAMILGYFRGSLKCYYHKDVGNTTKIHHEQLVSVRYERPGCWFNLRGWWRGCSNSGVTVFLGMTRTASSYSSLRLPDASMLYSSFRLWLFTEWKCLVLFVYISNHLINSAHRISPLALGPATWFFD